MDNFTNPPDVHFNVSDGKVFSLRGLNKLDHTICSIMYSHGIENNVDFLLLQQLAQSLTLRGFAPIPSKLTLRDFLLRNLNFKNF